jgi:drug/metabolite transporter (DMT)-like permease
VLISQITTTSTLYPLVAARFVSVIALIIVATVRREPWWPAPRMLGLLAIVGAFDSAGNAFFALSAKVGRLDVASVISSLYPAITVALAWAFLKEKMNGEQRFGIVLALIAITLIALPA